MVRALLPLLCAAVATAADAPLPRTRRLVAEQRPVCVVAYGDSISEVKPRWNGGAKTPDTNWAAVLVNTLGAKHPGSAFTLDHFGVGGENTAEGLARLDGLGKLAPDLVLVAFGANDCCHHFLEPAETGRALATLITDIRTRFGADVVVVGTGGDNPAKPFFRHLDETLAVQRQVAERAGVPFVDVRKAILEATAGGDRWAGFHLAADNCHPGDAGHAVWAGAAAATIEAALAARPPNVVLVVADDLGYADVGCFGATDIRTPHIDRLAVEGTRFTSFCVAQAVCTASRAALLTGCYPNRIGMAGALNHESPQGIHPQERLLSELLRDRGYATAAFGKWHLGIHPPFWPTRRGFDEFHGIPYSNDNGPLHPTMRGLPPLPLYEGDAVVETDPDQAGFTRGFTERAVRFIAANRDRPFFLYLPHVMPHVPIFAAERWRGKSGRGPYGDVVEELDWSVGEIMAALGRHGLDDDTLVVFTSDNGPFLSYGDHAGSARPLREGKLTAYEGGLRVPAVVRWRGVVPAGRTTDELVTTLDLFATIGAFAGAEPPRLETDGRDLRPLFRGAPAATGRDTFWCYAGDELHAVRQGRWKLHLAHDYLTVAGPAGRGGKPAKYGRMQPLGMTDSGVRGIASRHGYDVATQPRALYDLARDPGETTDVAADHPDVVARLEAVAAEARAELGDALTGARGAGVRPGGDIRRLGADPGPAAASDP